MGNKAEVVVLWATRLNVIDLSVVLAEKPKQVFLLVSEQSGNVKYFEDFLDLVLTELQSIGARVTILRPHPQRLYVNDVMFINQVLTNGALTDILHENSVVIGNHAELREMHKRAKIKRESNE